MKIRPKDYRVAEDRKIRLRDWPTNVRPLYGSEEEVRSLLEEHVKRLRSLQDRLYAANRYALLVVFQGMDASGKDAAIKHVMSGVNPQSCVVHSFKAPNEEELEHDFLWRAVVRLPERRKIGIFNRSYYEEVLVVRVHPDLLLNEGFSAKDRDRKSLWEDRYRSIRQFEHHLHRNGTRVLKFFLHVSREEQGRRLL